MKPGIIFFFCFLGLFAGAQPDGEFSRMHFLKSNPGQDIFNQPNLSYEFRFAKHIGIETGFGYFRPMPLVNFISYGMFSVKPFIVSGPEAKFAVRFFPGKKISNGPVLHAFVQLADKHYLHKQVREGGSSSYGYFKDESYQVTRLNTGLRIGWYFLVENFSSIEIYAGAGYAWRKGNYIIYSRNPDFNSPPVTYPQVIAADANSFTIHLGAVIGFQLRRKEKSSAAKIN